MALLKRDLNSMERFCYLYDKIAPFLGIGCIRITGELPVEILDKALEIVRKKHPYLSYYIKGGDENPAFIFDGKAGIPIRIIENGPDNLWISECNLELNRHILTDKAPLAEVTYIKIKNGADIIIKISHIITDGISLYHFIHDLFKTAGKLLNNEKIDPVEYLPEIYPDEKYFPITKGTSNLNYYIKKIENHETLIAIKNHSFEARSTNILPCNLSEARTEYIVKKCREHNITVNSLLAAALITGMRDYVRKKYFVKENFTIKSSSGLNLRKYYNCDIREDQMGCWAGFGYVHLDADEFQSIWDCAVIYSGKLKEFIESGASFRYLKNSVDSFSNNPLPENNIPGKTVIPYTILSNMGILNMDDRCSDKIKIERISITTPMHRHWSNDLNFGICSVTYKKRLNLIFSYLNPSRSQTEARDFAQGLLELIFDNNRIFSSKSGFDWN